MHTITLVKYKPHKELYTLYDEQNKLASWFLFLDQEIAFVLNHMSVTKRPVGTVIGTIDSIRLKMYLAINPDLTIKDLKAIMENSNV